MTGITLPITAPDAVPIAHVAASSSAIVATFSEGVHKGKNFFWIAYRVISTGRGLVSHPRAKILGFGTMDHADVYHP